MNYEIKKINWIETIFVPMQDTNSITIEILAKAWNIYENKENNGISHFLEHMFFKWWKKYKTPKEINETIESFWWYFNAFTSHNYAWYYVKSAPEFILKSIDVLWDMITYPNFNKEELEKEKLVVLQEKTLTNDRPTKLLYDLWREYFFGDNSYWRTILWTKKNIKNFTQDELFDYKNSLYTKDNLIIIVAGKINKQYEIENKIAESFWDLWEKKTIQKPKYKKTLPSQKENFFKKWTEQNHVILTSFWFDWNDEKKYIANIISTILAWNSSSRLFQEIREKRWLCYYIYGQHSSNPDFWLFFFKAWLQKNKFKEWINLIKKEILNIANWNINEKEFKNSMWFIKWQLQMWIETTDEMANFVWEQFLLYNKIETIKDILKKYENIKYDEIKKLSKILHNELYSFRIE